ncbi:MAG: peptidoglycan-binding domain-containing protein [Gemmatimonadota bacterium]
MLSAATLSAATSPPVRLFALAAGLLLVAGPARAQDRIGPASSIRIVELVDGAGTRLERTILEPMLPAEVLRLQVALARVGFDPRVRSGVVDAETETALRQFQLARGLEACGCPSYETVLALGVPVQVVGRAEMRRASGVRAADGSPVYVLERDGFVPGFFLHDGFFFHKRKHRPFFGSGVVVGGEPALGAGQVGRMIPRSSVGVREIVRPAPSRGGTIQPAVPGSGSGDGGSRPPRPRPQR